MAAPADRIALTGMRFRGYHGVLPEEREHGQAFVADVVIESDLRRAGETDELDATIDYRGVWDAAEAVLTGPPVRLIETLAEQLAGRLLQLDTRIAAVTVTIHKPEVPLPGPLLEAAVTIRRTRPGSAP